jgi:hypothetical protein
MYVLHQRIVSLFVTNEAGKKSQYGFKSAQTK